MDAASVRLRPVEEADLETLFLHQLDPVACELAGFASRDRGAFMTHWHKILADPACLALAIQYGHELVGNIGSFEMEGRREVGYWIDRDHWGRGIATQALRAFLDVERSRPLHAGVALHNTASMRVLEKCGFVPEHKDAEDILLVLR